jgi:hypothetical protein
MPPKSIFSALGAPMSLAWVHESPPVEGSALPKSVESGKLSLNKVGIGRMSDDMGEDIAMPERFLGTALGACSGAGVRGRFLELKKVTSRALLKKVTWRGSICRTELRQ